MSSLPRPISRRSGSRQVARTPHALALEAPEGRWTYAELDALAARLARELRRAGAGPEVPVAVVADRSAALVLAFLSIQKAGGAYLPLDPAQPASRLAFELADAAAAIVLTAEPWSALAAAVIAEAAAVSGRLPPILAADLAAVAGLPAGAPPGSPGVGGGPESLAYVIYTSGSTGTPKGVALPQGAAAVQMAAVAERWGLRPGDRMPLFASPGFDASVQELLAPWTAGAAVVVAGPELRQPQRFLVEIARRHLTAVHLPTAFWQAWVSAVESGEADVPPGLPLRAVFAGGEAMPVVTARRWWRSPLAGIELLNGYGPTEAVVTATWRTVDRATAETATGAVSIGRPLAGRGAYVLGPPRPSAAGGRPRRALPGRAAPRPRLPRPAGPDRASASCPIPSAPSAGARLYRTGDLVRWRADGRPRVPRPARRPGEGARLPGRAGRGRGGARRPPGVREAAVWRGARPPTASAARRLSYVAAAGAAPAVGGSAPPSPRRLPDAHDPASFVVLPALPLTAARQGRPPRARGAAAGARRRRGAPATRPPARRRSRSSLAGDLGRGARRRAGRRRRRLLRPRRPLAPRHPGDRRACAPPSASSCRCARSSRRRRSPAWREPSSGAARRGRRQRRPAADPARARRDGRLPLSFAQQRLWFLDRLEPGNPPTTCRWRCASPGLSTLAALAAASPRSSRRHEALRTTFAATAAAGRCSASRGR